MSEKARAVTALLVALVLVPGYGSVLHAQDTPKEPAAGAGATPAADKPAVPSTGQGRAPVIVAAATDTAEIRVQLTLDAATLEASDLELGFRRTIRTRCSECHRPSSLRQSPR